MADQLYMTINEDWLFDDDMNDYTATGWTVGTNGTVIQQSGYVQINATTGTDALIKFTPEKVLPYSFDMIVAGGVNQAFRMDNGTERMWVHFTSTDGTPRYYRLIVREYSMKPGSISFYENGKLIKEKPDLIEGTSFNSIYYYNTASSGSTETLLVFHHRHAWGVDWGPPTGSRMTDTLYLDGRDGYTLLFNRTGAEMPPFELIEDEIPFEAGSIHRQTNIQPRTISLGLLVSAESKSELNEKKRRLFSLLGAGKVKIYAKMSDGYRYLIGHYAGGLEGAENRDTSGVTFQKYVISFRVFFPFWQTVLKRSVSFTNTVTNFATGVINNNSTANDCYPEIYVHGPGTNPVIKNVTTGKSFQLTVNLATNNDYLYINTRPGERVIRDKNGVISWDRLSTGLNQLWSLEPGDNTISITFSSGSDSTTLTKVYFREVHWGT
jgi:hypothetical protein